MACGCIAEMDALLAEHNTKLGVTMAFPRDGTPGYCLPHIHTEKVEKRVRKGPALAIPTFCPFCGTRYQETKDARPEGGEGPLAGAVPGDPAADDGAGERDPGPGDR